MAFDTSVISQVYPPLFRAGGMVLRWDSTAPAGTSYQVYVSGELAWHGTALTCTLDPPAAGMQRIDVGAVGAGEETTDFSAGLTALANRAKLTWTGGPGQAADLAGWHVYGESTPGGGISYAAPLGTVPAVEQGVATDGYGMGGYGDPGYGSIQGTYAWTSDALTAGTWNYAVRSYDAAGNEANGLTTSVTIAAPPRPPAPGTGGSRLSYTYDPVLHRVTLLFLASPG